MQKCKRFRAAGRPGETHSLSRQMFPTRAGHPKRESEKYESYQIADIYLFLSGQNSGKIGYGLCAFLMNRPTLKFGIYQPVSNRKHALFFDEITFASIYEGTLL